MPQGSTPCSHPTRFVRSPLLASRGRVLKFVLLALLVGHSAAAAAAAVLELTGYYPSPFVEKRKKKISDLTSMHTRHYSVT